MPDPASACDSSSRVDPRRAASRGARAPWRHSAHDRAARQGSDRPPSTTRHGELHILRDVAGAPPYAQLRARALVIDLDGISLAIAGLDDLIAMKRAGGRPGDIRNIAALTAIGEHGER